VNITRFKFEEEIVDERSEWGALFRSEHVRCTMESIDRAIRGEPLEGRERLAVLQNLLLDLLSYLEKKEGFRISFGERGRATIEGRHADIISLDNQDIRILHQMPGRIRLGIPRLHGDAIYASRLEMLLQKLDHVKTVRINVDAACVVIEFSDNVKLPEFVNAVVALVENGLGSPSGNDDGLQPRSVSPSKRVSRSTTTVPS
jgi:hypothetical protein